MFGQSSTNKTTSSSFNPPDSLPTPTFFPSPPPPRSFFGLDYCPRWIFFLWTCRLDSLMRKPGWSHQSQYNYTCMYTQPTDVCVHSSAELWLGSAPSLSYRRVFHVYMCSSSTNDQCFPFLGLGTDDDEPTALRLRSVREWGSRLNQDSNL